MRDFWFLITGGKTPDIGSRTYTEIMREQLLKGEETELRKKLAEKAKEGTLKANGEPKPAPKKRGRWDQTDDAPTPKNLLVQLQHQHPGIMQM